MTINFQQLANPGVKYLKPYVPGMNISELEKQLGHTDIIKLASNENPLGCSQSVKQAIMQSLQHIERYPDSDSRQLKQRLSSHYAVDVNQLVVANGSETLLAMIVQCFGGPEWQAIISNYSFVTFAIVCYAHHTTPVIVDTDDWQIDCAAMLKHINPYTRLIFIANPNNPTGRYLNHSQLQQFLQQIPDNIIVVLDEAYYEYAVASVDDYPNSLALQQEFKNIIITRSFSKAYGLAGLRVGYLFAHPEVATLLERIRLPFNVSAPSLAAAEVALGDQQFIEDSVKANAAGREQLLAGFKRLGLSSIPSITNFLTVEFGPNTAAIHQALLQRGIIVRPLLNYQMPSQLRITIGSEQENQRLLTALTEIIQSA